VQVIVNGEKRKYGGSFNNELDAAKKVNQVCEENGISCKNHRIGTHAENQINNSESRTSVTSSEIDKAEEDDDAVTNANKRKRKNHLPVVNDNFPVEKYYFYDNFLN